MSEYVMPFGKFQGKSLDEIDLRELDNYLGWMDGLQSLSWRQQEARDMIDRYLQQDAIKRKLEKILEDD